MTTEFVRDAAATAAIFGFFASAWFGWVQERPPPSWRSMLIGGSVAALLLTVAGGVVTWREWSSGTVFDEDTSRAFGVVVGSEFAVASSTSWPPW
jgi:integral membrane sensor domain MASE1